MSTKVSVSNDFAGFLLANELLDRKSVEKTTNTFKKNSFFRLLEGSDIDQNTLSSFDSTVDDSLLEKAMDDVFVLGERLRHDHTLSYLADYKRSVKIFLGIILKKAYFHDRVKGRINRHNMMQKEYSLVRVIDEKLDKLAKAVLTEQRDMIYILSKIDEIRGLIINYIC